MIDSFISRTKRTRRWPLWARLLGACGFVLIFGAARTLLPWLPTYPVLLSFCAILASAVLFGRTPAYLALFLCNLFAIFVYLPHSGLAIQASSDVVGLLIFNAIGAATIALTSALYATADQLSAAQSELQSAQERVVHAERDKALLLREAGHRIKNNLMTLIGVIRLQERSSDDASVRSVLASAAERIQVFARVHDRLQASDSTAVIDLPDFLQELCDDLRSSVVNLKPIALTLEVERRRLPQHQAVALGLCVNELVTNAVKHAFPNERPGAIHVKFAREESGFHLAVIDDGKGLPHTAKSGREHSSIGQLLVRAMVAQLGGSFELGSGEGAGTKALVRFPAAQPAE